MRGALAITGGGGALAITGGGIAPRFFIAQAIIDPVSPGAALIMAARIMFAASCWPMPSRRSAAAMSAALPLGMGCGRGWGAGLAVGGSGAPSSDRAGPACNSEGTSEVSIFTL
jgi:hypothetical protein